MGIIISISLTERCNTRMSYLLTNVHGKISFGRIHFVSLTVEDRSINKLNEKNIIRVCKPPVVYDILIFKQIL